MPSNSGSHSVHHHVNMSLGAVLYPFENSMGKEGPSSNDVSYSDYQIVTQFLTYDISFVE